MGESSFQVGDFGILIAVLALAVCLVWLVLPFVVLSKLRGIRDEVEKSNQYLANFIKEISLALPSSAKPTVRVMPNARIVPTAKIVPMIRMVSPPSVVPLKISRGGKDLGLKDTTSIKVMLEKGDLSLQDRYYDAETNQWVTLDHHPEFS